MTAPSALCWVTGCGCVVCFCGRPRIFFVLNSTIFRGNLLSEERWRAMSYRRNNRPSQPCRDWKEGNPSSCRHGQNCRSAAVFPFLLCGADGAYVPSAALALPRRRVVALTNLQCARPRRFLHAGGGRSSDPPATMGAGGFGSTPFGGASGFGTNNTGGFGSFGAGNSFGSSGGGFGASSGGGFGGASGGGASGGKACKNWNGTPGSCQYGQRCKFVHSQPTGMRACFPSVCSHNPATDAHRSLHGRASACCS